MKGDSFGGLGTSLVPFYVAAKWRCAAVISGEWCRRGQGVRSAPAAATDQAGKLQARESKREYYAGRH